MKLPLDVLERIKKDFLNPDERRYIEKELNILINRSLNVGGDQLSRAIVFLSNKNIDTFKEVMNFDDPRDVLVEAENKAGNSGHYFINPFE